MKNKMKTLLIVGLLLIASVFVATAQYEPQTNNENNENFGVPSFHEEMEQIVENGSYQDLENYRNENEGFGGPRWVTDQKSFEQWKEHHEFMEEKGFGPGTLNGQGKRGSCPMMK